MREFFKDSGGELVLEHGSIDYNLLAVAQKMFMRNGFKVINVPWRVPKSYQQETTDIDLDIWINSEEDVGSAEQGFILFFREKTTGFSPWMNRV